MATFRRIITLFLLVLIVAGAGVSALAAESTYSVIMPLANYSFDYNATDGYSYSDLFDCSGIDPGLSVTIRINSAVYTGHWVYSDERDFWYFGDLSADNPFCVRYDSGKLCVFLAGPHSSYPGVSLELYQGNRHPEASDPNASLAGESISTMLGYVLGWFSTFWIQLIYGCLSPLVPILAVAVSIPLFLVLIRLIRYFF